MNSLASISGKAASWKWFNSDISSMNRWIISSIKHQDNCQNNKFISAKMISDTMTTESDFENTVWAVSLCFAKQQIIRWVNMKLLRCSDFSHSSAKQQNNWTLTPRLTTPSVPVQHPPVNLCRLPCWCLPVVLLWWPCQSLGGFPSRQFGLQRVSAFFFAAGSQWVPTFVFTCCRPPEGLSLHSLFLVLMLLSVYKVFVKSLLCFSLFCVISRSSSLRFLSCPVSVLLLVVLWSLFV